MMWHRQPKRFPRNAPGAFYSLGHIDSCGNWCGECLACEAPEALAPELLAALTGDNHDAYFVRQPETEQEIERACRATLVHRVDGFDRGPQPMVEKKHSPLFAGSHSI